MDRRAFGLHREADSELVSKVAHFLTTKKYYPTLIEHISGTAGRRKLKRADLESLKFSTLGKLVLKSLKKIFPKNPKIWDFFGKFWVKTQNSPRK